MKKALLIILFATVGIYVKAQWSTSGSVTSTSNSIGIGTASPSYMLHIKGANNAGVGVSSNIASYVEFLNTSGASMGYIGDSNNAFAFSGRTNVNEVHTLDNGNFIIQGANVGIGTSSPAEKLAVNGIIRAREIKVETTGWPDYVFESSHKLLSLNKLAAYIQQNKHLPEVPPASEVEKNGIELGEMNKLLLKKLEEVTLYLIELKDDNVSLKKDNTNLEKRLKTLESMLNSR